MGIDDPYGRVLRDRALANGLDVWTYALDDSSADLRAEAVECTAEYTRFALVSARDDREALIESTTLLGDFNVTNLLAAAATARAGGLPFDAVAAGLRSPIHVPGRFERVDGGGDFAVIVDYAHTPDALEHVLSAARVLTRFDGKVAVVYRLRRRSRPSQAAADGRGGRAPRGSRVPDLRQPPFRGPRRDRGRRARRCRAPIVDPWSSSIAAWPSAARWPTRDAATSS